MTRLLYALLALATALAAQQAPQPKHGQHGLHHSAEEYAKVLDDPKRDAWQKPDEVVRALELKPGATVADLGAGTGYFTVRLAGPVGPQGRVLAVDVDQRLLDRVRDRAAALKLGNVGTVLASANDPHLAARSADLIFICNVIHHIENRSAYYRLLGLALKPGGRLAIVDFHKREAPVGPALAMKIAREDLIREAEAGGFRMVREHTFLPHQYFLVFETQ
jgi:ubiquinone/menaquinone biosynthesis C-methylase UbiE